MAKVIVGITDYVTPPFDLESKAFGENVEFISFDSEQEQGLNPEQLKKCDALLVWHTPITKKTISNLDNCKIVVRYGVGFDAIDIQSLTDAGIPFCNTPDYGTEEVADTAMAMILGLQRRVYEYDFSCRFFKDGWQEHTLKPLTRTNQRTVGIVGVGRMGTAVVNRLKPFGCKILGYDPYQPSGHEKAVGYTRANELEDLLHESDIVSVHTPLSNETRGMINKKFINNMKNGSILINTARGPLLENLDILEEALKSGKLAAAGLDVLPNEPPENHTLILAWREYQPWLRGRLIINPHTSYYSNDAWQEMRYKAAETAAMFINNGKLRNRVLG